MSYVTGYCWLYIIYSVAVAIQGAVTQRPMMLCVCQPDTVTSVSVSPHSSPVDAISSCQQAEGKFGKTVKNTK